MDSTGNLETGDIVQLDPEKTVNLAFSGCLMVVTEVKIWGVQGYVQGLGRIRSEKGLQAYYRAEKGMYQFCKGGKAVWVEKI